MKRVHCCWTIGIACLLAANGAGQTSRLERLKTMVERINAAERGATPNNKPTKILDQGGISLVSPEGQAFVGRQLDQFDRSELGVLRTTKPAWISLYWTEGRDFVLSGEVNLGGGYPQMLFPGDLPDGFALFLREWDGVQRYQIDSRRALVKRRMHQGAKSTTVETVSELPEARRGEWIPFLASVSQASIEFTFGEASASIPGPLDIDGANKIVIAPGTKLRNLRLAFDTEAGAGTTPQETASAASAKPVASESVAAELVNGGFEEHSRTEDQGQFGEPMFAPGSKSLTGWTVHDGNVGLRQSPASPSGGLVLELGPRDIPGSVSQKVRTEPGKTYALSFFVSSGRSGGNSTVEVKVGQSEKRIDCGPIYERAVLPFTAQGESTEIRFKGVGQAGFGPMIDDVRVR